MKKICFTIAIIISLSSYSQEKKGVTEKLKIGNMYQYKPQNNTLSINFVTTKKAKITLIDGDIQYIKQQETVNQEVIEIEKPFNSQQKKNKLISFRLNLDTKKE